MRTSPPMAGSFSGVIHATMLTDYLIIVSATSAVTLIWRNLKEDHPSLKRAVGSIPFFGEALSCGFCFAMWASLAAVLVHDPLAGWQGPFPIVASWLSVGSGVLLLRSAIIVLLEAGAVLKHRHQSGHR